MNIQDRAVAILKKRGPITASQLGWELWGNTTSAPMRGEGSHGNNKFCLPAGKLLNKLRAAGKAYWGTEGPRVLWKLTKEGKGNG